MRRIKKLFIPFLVAGIFFSAIFDLTAGIVVLNGLTHENIGQPGESYRGIIQIQNTDGNGKSVRVYQKDYWFSYTGESNHEPAGTSLRSNANWITYNPELLTLDSGQVATIDFEIKIPAEDSLKGTYWSVIMVEGITPPDTTKSEGGVKINTAIRYAIQIVTNIGNTGKRDLQFIDLQLTKENETSILTVAMENIGERLLKPELSLELFDAEGNTSGIIKSEPRKTYPGTSIKSTLIMEGIKPGNYNAVLVADCGDDSIFGTNLSLEIQ